MAATSVGKLGKLDAICARLKLTQKVSSDEGGLDVSSSLDAVGNQNLKTGRKENVTGSPGINGKENGSETSAVSFDKSAKEDGKEKAVETSSKADKVCSIQEKEAVVENLENESRDSQKVVLEDVTEDSTLNNNIQSNNNSSKTIDYNKELTISSMQEDSPGICLGEQSASPSTVEPNKTDIETLPSCTPEVLTPVSSSQSLNNDCDQSTSPSTLHQSTSINSTSAQVSSESLSPFSSSPLESSAHLEDDNKSENEMTVENNNGKHQTTTSPDDKQSTDDQGITQSDLTLKEDLCEDTKAASTAPIPTAPDSSGSDSLPSTEENPSVEECNKSSKTSNIAQNGCNNEAKDEIEERKESESENIDKVSHRTSNLNILNKEPETIPLPVKTVAKSPDGTADTPESSSGSGRRKSRKAAKPQKQVGVRYFVDPDLTDSDLFPDYDKVPGLQDSVQPVKDGDINDVMMVPKGDAPLDLSSGTSCKSTVTLSQNERSASGMSNTKDLSSSNKGAEITNPSESAYSNILVDYAKNTMSELLGIYGFEGSEARNLTLGKMLQFSEGKGRKIEKEEGQMTDVDMKSEIDQSMQPADNDNADTPVKSGPFRKKVYTSLTHPSIGNGQNGHIIKAPSPPLPTPVLAATSSTSSSEFPKNKQAVVKSSSNAKTSTPNPAKRQYTTKTFSSSDFHKYIRRYANGLDCGGEHCHDLGYRDHYHCLDCPTKVFIRKEEMVRHFKWHKKRQDSLQHGFMRYSPVDDCSVRFGACTHNGRQTHYHCVQRGCDKVYISTSDVQMHANFHRKDSAIIQEGFQRFRATEDCGTTYCAFYGQRTTHFHCRRPQCNFTFKNKSDMEKHKSYHQKDEILSKDGFKKFMKYEPCNYAGCGYSKVSNHIHCIRAGCQYVLHSTAQLYSHKRKHERRDFENAYQRYSQVGQQNSSASLSSPSVNGGPGGGNKPVFSGNDILVNQGKTTGIPLMSASNIKTEHEGGQKIKNPMEEDPDEIFLTGQNPVNVNQRNPFALNLTKKENGNTAKNKFVGNLNEDERQTMALPLNLGKKDENSSSETEEAEDLSLNSKKWTTMNNDLKEENIVSDGIQLKEDLKFEFVDPALTAHNDENDYIDDDEDDDDDDDDDDDKDYTQVEEPTLVNGFRGLMDEVDMKEEFDHGKMAALDSEKEVEKVKKEMIQQPQTLSQPTTVASVISDANGQVVGINHIPKLNPEKKERDESWKKYLIRYTANDACFSRCACLYKDHYHCRVESCQVIFKSKDGVRGHARFHELQDSITPLVYCKADEKAACGYDGCPYSKKELHYHCNWTNCNQVIPHNGPTFALLEHYRIHSLGMTYMNKGKTVVATQQSQVELDPLQKRRGRPPKYPRYDRPVVPKVHLTEKEILDSTLAFMHNKYSKNSTIINGFKKFEDSEGCPDDNCIFQRNKHFHCGRKFCHMSTDRLDFLNLHAKDFHNNITILDGYEFFERVVDCRRPHCHNNRINRHFHCIRPRCDYSFVRHSTMSQHNKKHPTAMAAVLLTTPTTSSPVQHPNKNSVKTSSQQYVPIAPATKKVSAEQVTPLSSPSPSSSIKRKSPVISPVNCSNSLDETVKDGESIGLEGKTIIKSAGTFFPLSGIPNVQLASTSSNDVSNCVPQNSSSHKSDSAINTVAASVTQPNINATIIQSTPSAPGLSISGQQLTAAGGAQIIKPGLMGLSVPANMMPTSIPVLTQTSQGQQPSILTGIVPLGNISHQAVATSQFVNIPGAQIITSQVPFIQTGVLGGNMVQLIQNPVPVINTAPSPVTAAVVPNIGNARALTSNAPLTILLQPGMSSPLSWANLKKRMHYPVEANCGRPFCKLKKKDHFHCLDCNQAFSDHARLRVHIGKHGFKFKKSDHNGKVDDDNATGISYVQSRVHSPASTKIKAKSFKPEQNADSCEDDKLSSSLNIQLSAFTDMVNKGKEAEAKEAKSKSSPTPNEKITLVMSNVNSQWTIGKGDNKAVIQSPIHNKSSMDVGESDDDEQPSLMIDDGLDESNDSSLNDSSSSLTLCSSLSRKSGRKRSLVKNDDYVSSDSLIIPSSPKQRKIYELPAGYKRVRCGEDCGYKRCSYRQTVTHFHCLRGDCGYGFSDKSRIMQHSIRHERLDKLMGGEFLQFRASVSCQRDACEFDEKASHFHCLKCSFACADSSKVPPHRKYHTKLENVSSNGFMKYSGTADCQTATCTYFRKQTHYHCSFPGCNHSVLGPSQMASHKLKHS